MKITHYYLFICSLLSGSVMLGIPAYGVMRESSPHTASPFLRKKIIYLEESIMRKSYSCYLYGKELPLEIKQLFVRGTICSFLQTYNTTYKNKRNWWDPSLWEENRLGSIQTKVSGQLFLFCHKIEHPQLSDLPDLKLFWWHPRAGPEDTPATYKESIHTYLTPYIQKQSAIVRKFLWGDSPLPYIQACFNTNKEFKPTSFLANLLSGKSIPCLEDMNPFIFPEYMTSCLKVFLDHQENPNQHCIFYDSNKKISIHPLVLLASPHFQKLLKKRERFGEDTVFSEEGIDKIRYNLMEVYLTHSDPKQHFLPSDIQTIQESTGGILHDDVVLTILSYVGIMDINATYKGYTALDYLEKPTEAYSLLEENGGRHNQRHLYTMTKFAHKARKSLEPDSTPKVIAYTAGALFIGGRLLGEILSLFEAIENNNIEEEESDV